MKKLFLIGCIMIFVFCAPKKATVETEGLEEVIVFGEEGEQTEETYISEEPVLPEETAPTVEEEPVLPTPEEEEIVAPPIEEEVPITPPPLPITEEEITAPPLPVEEEEITAPPVIEEEVAITAPPLPAIEEEITAPPVIEEPVAPPSVTPTPPPPTPAPAQVYGFRVQIFASSTENNANKVANDARGSFNDNVYVQKVAPYYKVRIGDFITRNNAEKVKDQAIKLGYRGAFIVETMVSP